MKKIIAVLIVSLMLMSLSSVQAQQGETESTLIGYVRFAHFAEFTDVDQIAIDAMIDDDQTGFFGVEYLTLTDWLPISAGEHSFFIDTALLPINEPLAQLIDYKVLPGTWTTFLLSETRPMTITPIVADYSETPPGEGQTTMMNILNSK